MALRFVAFAVACTTLLCPLQAQGPPGLPGPPGGPPVPEDLTVLVDCDAGDSLQAALDRRADRLTVEFSGTCAEDVTIARDDVILRGQPGAILVGDPTASFQPALTVTGSRIALEDFTVSDDDNHGIFVRDGAAVDVTRVESRDNPSTGLRVFDSFVRVTDSRFLDNGFLGIGIWGSSSLRVRGVVETSRNVGGLSLSAGSGAQGDLGPERLEVVDNSFIGVNLQFSSGLQMESVLVTGSPFGINVFQDSSFSADAEVRENLVGVLVTDGSSYGSGAPVTDNDLWGVRCESNSVIDVAGDVSRNGDAGIQVLEGCSGQLGSQTFALTVTGNGRVGVEVDASTAILENATLSGNGTDLQLAFESRATFGAGNALGSVTCDGTVLTRGASVCSAPASLRYSFPDSNHGASGGLSDLPPEVRRLLAGGGGAPFRFEP